MINKNNCNKCREIIKDYEFEVKEQTDLENTTRTKNNKC